MHSDCGIRNSYVGDFCECTVVKTEKKSLITGTNEVTFLENTRAWADLIRSGMSAAEISSVLLGG